MWRKWTVPRKRRTGGGCCSYPGGMRILDAAAAHALSPYYYYSTRRNHPASRHQKHDNWFVQQKQLLGDQLWEHARIWQPSHNNNKKPNMTWAELERLAVQAVPLTMPHPDNPQRRRQLLWNSQESFKKSCALFKGLTLRLASKGDSTSTTAYRKSRSISKHQDDQEWYTTHWDQTLIALMRSWKALSEYRDHHHSALMLSAANQDHQESTAPPAPPPPTVSSWWQWLNTTFLGGLDPSTHNSTLPRIEEEDWERPTANVYTKVFAALYFKLHQDPKRRRVVLDQLIGIMGEKDIMMYENPRLLELRVRYWVDSHSFGSLKKAEDELTEYGRRQVNNNNNNNISNQDRKILRRAFRSLVEGYGNRVEETKDSVVMHRLTKLLDDAFQSLPEHQHERKKILYARTNPLMEILALDVWRWNRLCVFCFRAFAQMPPARYDSNNPEAYFSAIESFIVKVYGTEQWEHFVSPHFSKAPFGHKSSTKHANVSLPKEYESLSYIVQAYCQPPYYKPRIEKARRIVLRMKHIEKSDNKKEEYYPNEGTYEALVKAWVALEQEGESMSQPASSLALNMIDRMVRNKIRPSERMWSAIQFISSSPDYYPRLLDRFRMLKPHHWNGIGSDPVRYEWSLVAQYLALQITNGAPIRSSWAHLEALERSKKPLFASYWKRSYNPQLALPYEGFPEHDNDFLYFYFFDVFDEATQASREENAYLEAAIFAARLERSDLLEDDRQKKEWQKFMDASAKAQWERRKRINRQ